MTHLLDTQYVCKDHISILSL